MSQGIEGKLRERVSFLVKYDQNNENSPYMPYHIANYILSFYFHILMNVSTYFVESFTCFCILLCAIISRAAYVLYEKVQYIIFKGRVKGGFDWEVKGLFYIKVHNFIS